MSKNDIPKSISYKGKLINAISYSDNDGGHILICTETGKIPSKNSADDFHEAALYANNYVVDSDLIKQYWHVSDFVKDCSFDIVAYYLPNTLSVTDLNNDGKAEVWLMYRTSCTSDVSPSEMKVIMYEGKQKFAMRGVSRTRISDKEYYGGSYSFDNAFKNGPQVFKIYAQKLWKKNLIQVWK